MSQPTPRCGESYPYTLKDLGWTEEHERTFAKYTGPYLPGRVACRQKTVWDVLIDGGSVTVGISGALRRLGRFPAVGDFVVLLHQPKAGTSTIVDILPRKT
ncbi:MAG: ribosome small subunit-dependent GTPase, partial [Methanoculleus thermophilus]|nr:ribosome small subunit-dependent GTPase [Methanoculleus thermophilus]